MNDVNLLLDLPLGTLIPLAAGYLAYLLGWVGRDTHHHTADVVFLSLVFAAITRGVAFMVTPQLPELVALTGGGVAALIVSGLWRRFLGRWVANALRDSGIVRHDRYESAWRSIVAREGKKVTQVVVYRKDGAVLMCDDTSQFAQSPFGPGIFGPDGSVAIYVTSMRQSGSAEWQDTREEPTEWGQELTYIPASEISEIAVRFRSPISLALAAAKT